ncbi:MAG: hypothetical protein A4E39_01696 [Methanoregulaceae archaeon PtaB.Bin152]|nr:MAG: hypothetical protein A4E39_01696 [Methanoregulaceae archaeon PtaB.Bin152]
MLGVTPVVAGNQAARMQIEVSDPLHHYAGQMVDLDTSPLSLCQVRDAGVEVHYAGQMVDLDTCIADLAEGKRGYSYYMVFVHNDAGISYAATVQSITGKRVVAIVYGEHFREMSETIDFPCEKIAAKAVHNPMPLKKKIDEVIHWVVSNL